MGRIEAFTRDGNDFVYLDMTKFTSREEFYELLADARAFISGYQEGSLYLITNVEGMKFDSECKQHMMDFISHNNFYVKKSAVVGVSGAIKAIANSMFKALGRKSMRFTFTREKAIEWLLEKE